MLDIALFLIAVGIFMMLDMIKPSYGVVFDVASGEYVDTAFVVLINADTGKEISRVLTDMYGRYYFFVQPGRYKLQVERTHFSIRYNNGPSAVLYGAPYDGGVITRNEESTISIPLALHKDAPDWNHENKLRIKRDIAGSSVYWRWFGLVVVATHLVVSTVLFILSLSILYGVLVIMMLVWWGVFLYDHSPVNGTVGWGEHGKYGGYMSIHGYADTLIRVVKLSRNGYYWSLIPPGNYTVRLYEYNNPEGTKQSLVSEYQHVSVPDGILNKSFLVK